jgi:hypothetical protein
LRVRNALVVILERAHKERSPALRISAGLAER